MEAIILKTLQAIKAKGFDINREILDNVNYCISLIADAEAPEAPKDTKDTKDTEAPGDTKEADPPPAIDTLAEKPTREDLNKMKYWDIRKEYNITGEKSMKKDELIEVILKGYKD